MQAATGQVSTLRSVVESLQDVGAWALRFWWVFVIVLGVLAIKCGAAFIERRLADHRSGANLRI